MTPTRNGLKRGVCPQLRVHAFPGRDGVGTPSEVTSWLTSPITYQRAPSTRSTGALVG
jgi:hypothetical protein